MRRLWWIAALALCASHTVEAYTRITFAAFGPTRFSSSPIRYFINDQGYPGVSNGSEFDAIHEAFNTWQSVEQTSIAFEFAGTTGIGRAGRDDQNIVSFVDDQSPLSSSTIAATFTYFRVVGSSITAAEADIVFNPAFRFSTTIEPGRFDVQGVMTHEIGHLLGLDHSGMVSSVMTPFGAIGVPDQRVLSYDDIAGIREVYPLPLLRPIVGMVSGRVLSGDQPVFGAHVVIADASGTALVSTLSQRDGSYRFVDILPGSYRIYAEPLDRPVQESNIGGGSNGLYRNLNTDFETTFFGDVAGYSQAAVLSVGLGQSPQADIHVRPKSPGAPNLTTPSVAPRIPIGQERTWRSGGQDITPGATFSTSAASVMLEQPVFGGSISASAPTSASMGMVVMPDTPPGPKLFMASRNGSVSVVSGAFVVTGPAPSDIRVEPSVGPSEGGTLVTITGRQFRPGARIYFGGRRAAAQFINSGTILATAPPNTGGTSAVQVMNPDGAFASVNDGFHYILPPPQILRVEPSAGSPTTIVTLEGAHFDRNLSNVEVRFGGARARVIGASAGQLRAVVPFDASSGPVSVTVFGVTASGPEFSVVPPEASANRPPADFRFVDADPSAGGVPLRFANLDDGLASVDLPFGFVLFRDAYAAGSRLSVATNGWLSLETASSPEYHNPSLPALEVSRPNGSSGAAPASLLAPFFDDLVLKPSSTVTVLTLGDAPTRRFIVQWSDVAILDSPEGEASSSLTFQVVLFEGSYDVQFVYASLTGTGADGSNATVGMQDLARETAVQVGFNEPLLNSGLAITFSFQNGSYAVSSLRSTSQ